MPRLKIGKVVGASGESLEPKGIYDPSVTYHKRDLITYNNSSYVALKETTGNLPTNTMFWQLNAEGMGGTANDVEYDNSTSQINSTNVQLAIDELNEIIKENSSSVPDGVTYVPVGDGEVEIINPEPIDADTLEGHAADYFAAKEDIPEPTPPWDYHVPTGQPITLGDKYRLTSASTGNFIIQTHNNDAWGIFFSILSSGMVQSHVPFSALNGINITGETKVNGILHIIDHILQLDYQYIEFRKASSPTKYIGVSPGGLMGFYPTPQLLAMSIAENGTVTFTKDIVAPNIPSTTSLLTTEQEITELDLQNLAAQQQMTDLELQVITLSAQTEQTTQTNAANTTETNESKHRR